MKWTGRRRGFPWPSPPQPVPCPQNLAPVSLPPELLFVATGEASLTRRHRHSLSHRLGAGSLRSRFSGLVPPRLPEGPSCRLPASSGRWRPLAGKPLPPVSAAVTRVLLLSVSVPASALVAPCPPPLRICARLCSLGNKLLQFEATQTRVTCSGTTHCDSVQAPPNLLAPVASAVSFLNRNLGISGSGCIRFEPHQLQVLSLV